MSSISFVLFAQHGWADTNRAIASLANSITSDTVPVIAPNLGWLRTWVRIEPLIQQVEHLAEDAIERYPDHDWRIMGHSMGALIWVELLHRHPEWWSRVHSLCLVGSPVGGSDLGRIIDPLELGLAIAKDLGKNRRPLAEAIASRIPTLVIAGDTDGGSDGTVTVECTKVPRASSVILPGIAHATLKDHPLVGQAIQSFWSSPSIAAPEADSPSLQIIQQLRLIPGMTDAHYRDAYRGRAIADLSDGNTVRAWTNGIGILHVFVLDQNKNCLYAGYAGWLHRENLQNYLNTLPNL
ncbi:MAG: lysophospholipase [Cyanobacteria bacterium P01_F01_bin.150]